MTCVCANRFAFCVVNLWDTYYTFLIEWPKVRHGEKRRNSELLYWRLCCWRCGINSYVLWWLNSWCVNYSTCCTEPLTPLTRRQTATWLNQLDVMWCDSVSADNIRTTFVCLYCAAIWNSLPDSLKDTVPSDCHSLLHILFADAESPRFHEMFFFSR